MGAPPTSQVAPLPRSLPFRVVSKTVGSGAYASIRKASPVDRPTPIIAVKFINKEHAFNVGRLRPQQIELELTLHKSVSGHNNVIQYIRSGSDENWIWLAMELAEGGDLFDKIEADEGVSEDIAHLYFSQLVAGIGWCHGKGVAHRDIKPENILLSVKGDLKLADFGLATQFMDPKTGATKQCHMVCGSPPYIAPEILRTGQANLKRKSAETAKVGYHAASADVWSCAIVLFVLCAGNTPWDSPDASESWEFDEYIKTNGRPDDELWTKIPVDALSLLRGMLRIDTTERLTLADVHKHPWFTRANRYLTTEGKAADPLSLATQMLEKLHIDFSEVVPASQTSTERHAMDIDPPEQVKGWPRLASTQPDTPTTDLTFEWERPARLGLLSASQPTNHDRIGNDIMDAAFMDRLGDEPSMSQFAPTPSVPLSLTQMAREFNDILPAYSMAQFVSTLPITTLVSMLTSALHRLNIPIAPMSSVDIQADRTIAIRIKTLDARRQKMYGNIIVERIRDGLHEVRFVKAKGDPLGWRRLFKHVAILCKDAIVKRDF